MYLLTYLHDNDTYFPWTTRAVMWLKASKCWLAFSKPLATL